MAKFSQPYTRSQFDLRFISVTNALFIPLPAKSLTKTLSTASNCSREHEVWAMDDFTAYWALSLDPSSKLRVVCISTIDLQILIAMGVSIEVSLSYTVALLSITRKS